MFSAPPDVEVTEDPWQEHAVVGVLTVITLLYLFLVGVNGLGSGFRALGQGVLESFFALHKFPRSKLTLYAKRSTTRCIEIGFSSL